jgi:hypothetical protein
MKEPIEIQLVIRQGCHLCVAAESDLARVIARFAAEYPEREYTVELVDMADYEESAALQRGSASFAHQRTSKISFWRIDEQRAFEKLSELA